MMNAVASQSIEARRIQIEAVMSQDAQLHFTRAIRKLIPAKKAT